MADIKMNISPEVILGSEKRLGDELVFWGERVLIVGESALKDQIDEVRRSLESRGLKVLLFTDVEPELSTFSIHDALSMARGSRSDVILGMGGVKILQLARTVAALAPGGIFIEDYFQGKARPDRGLPYVEVPTSARNPFMLREDALMTETRSRRTRIVPLSKKMVKLVLIDPVLTSTLSDRYTQMVLMDILLTAVENYLTPRASFFTDVQSRASIDKASKALFGFKEKGEFSIHHRYLLCESAIFSAYASALNGVGPISLLIYSLSNFSGVPKSSIASVLLPVLAESSFYPAGEKKDNISSLCYVEGFPEEFRRENPGDTFRRAQGLYGLPSRLSDLGLKQATLSEASTIAYAMTENLYPEVTQDNLLALLHKAF